MALCRASYRLIGKITAVNLPFANSGGLEKSLDERKIVAIASLDLSKAFSNIPHNLFLAKLKAYGVHDGSLVLLESYLSGRQQRIKLNGSYSSWQNISRGIPQGLVLSPLFFNIFYSDFFHFVREVSVSAYVDDIQLYDSDKDPVKLEARLQKDLRDADK